MDSRGGESASGMAQAAAYWQKLQTKQSPSNIFQIKDNTGQNTNQNFPVSLGSTDLQDVEMQMRKDLVNDAGIVPGMGQAVVDQNFFNYAARKDAMQQLANYQEYTMQNADLTTPEKAAWWFEHFPWMKEKRTEEVKRVSELQQHAAKISILGPQNDEDFMLLYMVAQGLVTIPDKPVHQLGMSDYAADSYVAGFFSPLAKQPVPAQVSNTKVPWNDPWGKWTASPFSGIGAAPNFKYLLGNNRLSPGGFSTAVPFLQNGTPSNAWFTSGQRSSANNSKPQIELPGFPR